MRRHDLDCLRVIAIALLIVYHTAIVFQPWSHSLYFLQSDSLFESIWGVMTLFNVWRIPLLFSISGMGVYFAISRRDYWGLIKERTQRILIPFMFGSCCIVPLHFFLYQQFYQTKTTYIIHSFHLWFLLNIYLYVLLSAPLLFYIKNRPDHPILNRIKQMSRHPLGLYLFALPLMIEVMYIDPHHFSMYANTSHGFWLGWIMFLYGFLWGAMKGEFWRATQSIKWMTLGVAVLLYITRILLFKEHSPLIFISFESLNWVLSLFGFASAYVNRSSPTLTYLNQAVYPVYITHMIFISLAVYCLLPQPNETTKVDRVTSIEEGGVAQSAGLKRGDRLLDVEWALIKPEMPVTFKVQRAIQKNNSKTTPTFEVQLTPNAEGKLGISLSDFSVMTPHFNTSPSSGFTLSIKFILLTVFTFLGSFLSYEWIIKRVRYLRPLFGLK